MPDWIVWMIFGFIVYRLCVASGSSCSRGISGSRYRDHKDDRELTGGRPTQVSMRRGPARNPETPIQAAQRRFVEGATTVEEYEAELDHALRERPSFGGGAAAETAPRTTHI